MNVNTTSRIRHDVQVKQPPTHKPHVLSTGVMYVENPPAVRDFLDVQAVEVGAAGELRITSRCLMPGRQAKVTVFAAAQWSEFTTTTREDELETFRRIRRRSDRRDPPLRRVRRRDGASPAEEAMIDFRPRAEMTHGAARHILSAKRSTYSCVSGS